MQMLVLAISLAIMAVVAWAFWAAASGAGSGAEGAEGRRNPLIIGLAVIGVLVTAASLRPWPHAAAAGAAVINVSGGQFYWEIDAETVPLGVPVAFNAHTTDVTHGFGVMDASGRILLQVQAMPGYVNRVDYTFDAPGLYRVVCLEYCGIAHHDMQTEFTVAAAN